MLKICKNVYLEYNDFMRKNNNSFSDIFVKKMQTKK